VFIVAYSVERIGDAKVHKSKQEHKSIRKQGHKDIATQDVAWVLNIKGDCTYQGIEVDVDDVRDVVRR
jgi:hypothetical protein